jgi:cytochrome c oxidase cbb3-type subunit 4
MLKFVKHNLDSIDGVEIYPIILLLFSLQHLLLYTIWAFTYSKEKIKEISESSFKR